MQTPSPHISRLVDDLFRNEAGRITSILTRIFGFRHSELVEDIVQETFLTALKKWGWHGIPDNPSAWLLTVARNKTINALKSYRSRMGSSLDESVKWKDYSEEEVKTFFLDNEIEDSQLRILFACCAPVLSEKTQIALTLKTVSGFSNAEIAGGLLMGEEAVKKMIYRARKQLRSEDSPPGVPFRDRASERLDAVHVVCYLMFNEGYKRSEGDLLIKEGLCREAMRLADLLYRFDNEKPNPESAALLALMLFNASRFPARQGGDGLMKDLKEQDRTLWDQAMIKRGFYFLAKARESDYASRYHLEAGIASVHCIAPSYEEIDWKTIVYYYKRLLKLGDNPVIRLNYAIALSNLEGPEAGLKTLDDSDLQKPLDQYFLLYAAKADMNFRLGNYEQAKSFYRLALELSKAESDRKFLESKIRKCDLKNFNGN